MVSKKFWMGDFGMAMGVSRKALYQRGIQGIHHRPASRGARAVLSASIGRAILSRFPIGYTMSALQEFHRISTDRRRYNAMLMAVRHLRRLGYRKLGLALDFNQDARVDHQWSAAFHWDQRLIHSARRTEIFLVLESGLDGAKLCPLVCEESP